MPNTTGQGITYPVSTDTVHLTDDLATMANSVDAALVADRARLDNLDDTKHCSVYADPATISLPTGAVSVLCTFAQEVEDTDNMHSTSSNTGRVTFNTAGRYSLNIFVALPNVATVYSKFRVNLRLNSAGSSSGGSSIRTFIWDTPGGAPQDFSTSLLRYFTAGDHVEVYAAQDGSSTRVLDGGGPYITGLQAIRVANS